MNYRHAFHAGNASDVFKHATLALILRHLCAKPAAFAVIDVHAGVGRYDLSSESAGRTGEFRQGIGALFGQASPHPDLAPYLDAVQALNPDGMLRWYPGSPRLAASVLRPHDRMVLCELHGEDHGLLKREFAGDRRVAVHKTDAWHALKAFLPPPERRGVVLIDPPFEAPDEFARLVRGLGEAYRRWPAGIFVLWHPIKERPAVWRFHEALETSGLPRILAAEMTVHPEDTHLRLNGSGLIIVNPPWQLDTTLAAMLPCLHAALPTTGGGSRVTWLSPEHRAGTGTEPDV